MSNDKRNETSNEISEHIFLTNYFVGGEEKRREILAQPEAWCSCPQCGVCNCGAECTNCSACDASCETQCMSSIPYATNSSGPGTISATTSAILNQVAVNVATATITAADYNSNNSTGWSNFWGG
jgi:hypothetical protein